MNTEELHLSLARHGGTALKGRLQQERLVYEDHIQALSSAERARRAEPSDPNSELCSNVVGSKNRIKIRYYYY